MNEAVFWICSHDCRCDMMDSKTEGSDMFAFPAPVQWLYSAASVFVVGRECRFGSPLRKERWSKAIMRHVTGGEPTINSSGADKPLPDVLGTRFLASHLVAFPFWQVRTLETYTFQVGYQESRTAFHTGQSRMVHVISAVHLKRYSRDTTYDHAFNIEFKRRF